MSSARFIVGDVFDVLAKLPDNSVDLVLSSPPFLALRSYLPADHPDKSREIGSEATPADFIDTLLDVVEACDRVLCPHGSLVFELGDTYSGSGGAGGDYSDEGLRAEQPRFDGSAARTRASGPRTEDESRLGVDARNRARRGGNAIACRENVGAWPLAKSLTGIPSLFAFSLAYGRNLLRPERTTEPWRVRNVVAWCRPNPPVGALGDKFRPGTSYLTVACKARDRWFDLDAVRTEAKVQMGREVDGNNIKGSDGSSFRFDKRIDSNPAGAPPLDFWVIPTEPYKGSHYATWPSDLLIKPIKAMCPERVCRVCGVASRRIVGDTDQYAEFKSQNQWDTGGKVTSNLHRPNIDFSMIRTATLGWTDCGHDDWRNGVVLDPFAGSGTTLMVATGHGRDAIGIDLDSRNADLARERVGMWLEVEQQMSDPATITILPAQGKYLVACSCGFRATQTTQDFAEERRVLHEGSHE